MAFSTNQSFEPRIGTAQMIFGVIYTFITLIALCLAFYERQDGGDGYLQLCMAVLFAIMAGKSFFISARVKRLLREGVYFEAQVDSCEPVRGITVIKGVCDIPNYGLIHIESRLVGENIGRELKAFMADHKQNKLPALVVGADGKYPRGMFTVKGLHGHLIPESAMLKGQTADDLAEQKQNNSALEPATARAKAATRRAEEQKQQEQEAAAAAATASAADSDAATEANADSSAAAPEAETVATADAAADAADAADAAATDTEQGVGAKRQSSKDAALMAALKDKEQS